MDTSKDLTQALYAFQSGDRETAKRLLAATLRADPQNVQAWLWMSEAADTDEQKRDCLVHVLALEPANEKARAALARLAESTLRSQPNRQGISATPVEPPDLAHHHKVERYMTLAGGLSLTLLVGLALLALILGRAIPQARDQSRSSPEQTLHTATLWCPSCERQGQPVILSTRIGASFYQGARASGLPHGTRVSVLRYRWATLEGRYYALVAAEGKRGWVPETQIMK
jgi:hypothetical protein